jgi:monooxygenase
MSTDHVDVLIVGAGLSGIGAGYHLQSNCPGKSYAIFEAREGIGGTWDLFRYPGIRSDSDMFTLGYSFKPWREAKAIADGPSILEYVRETARDNGIDRHIRFGHRVTRVTWSSADARWTVEAQRASTGETVVLTAGFVFNCTGYYRYDEGFTPAFPGMDRFGGQIVHPQHWPEDLDYAGKRVVVIGSGATAVTLVPAMAERAAHVTMLQRSPSYVLALPARDPIADAVRKVLPAKVAYPIVRWKNVTLTTLFFQLSRRAPKVAKALIRKGVEKQLPEGFDIDRHFTPKYDPWDQRVCLVPDGDLFGALRRGSASIATDTIETFTETGLRLTSGEELEADIIVTATGLNLLALGGTEVVVDGEPVTLSETVGYKGMMFSDIPNLAIAVGYTNASWTLKCDLTCEYVCRLLNHMDDRGYRRVTPRQRDAALETQPFIDLQSGYVLRSIDAFPKQGIRAPWRLYQNYARDIMLLKFGALEDEALEFSAGARAVAPPEPLAA